MSLKEALPRRVFSLRYLATHVLDASRSSATAAATLGSPFCIVSVVRTLPITSLVSRTYSSSAAAIEGGGATAGRSTRGSAAAARDSTNSRLLLGAPLEASGGAAAAGRKDALELAACGLISGVDAIAVVIAIEKETLGREERGIVSDLFFSFFRSDTERDGESGGGPEEEEGTRQRLPLPVRSPYPLGRYGKTDGG